MAWGKCEKKLDLEGPSAGRKKVYLIHQDTQREGRHPKMHLKETMGVEKLKKEKR